MIYIKMIVRDVITNEIIADNDEEVYNGDKDPSTFYDLVIGNDIIHWEFRDASL